VPCPILRRNLPTAIRLIGPHFPRRARCRRARARQAVEDGDRI
jgi:hypothetical protein